MQLDELPHDCEPDPGAARYRRSGSDAAERLPDPHGIACIDAGTLIRHFDDRAVTRAGQGELDGLADGSVLHGVVEQVEEDLFERAGVDVCFDRVVEAGRDLRLARGCERSKPFDDFADHRREPRGCRRDLRRPPFAARKEQNIFDELREPLRLARDDLERTASLVFGPDAPEEQRL